MAKEVNKKIRYLNSKMLPFYEKKIFSDFATMANSNGTDWKYIWVVSIE